MNKKLLRKKLALMLANLRKKRPYYCEVEYLHSDGNQYIDTGFVMESGKTMTFNGNMMWTQSQGAANFFYGYRSTSSAEYRGDMRAFFVYGASPAGRVAIRYGVNTDNSTNVAVSLNTKFNIEFDGTNLKVNGTTYATLTQAYTPADYKSMWLFNCNTTGYYSADVNHFIGRIYNWQIWSGGVMVRDLIPVLDWDMKPAMYDKITRQLFYNKGTGNFTYGREIHYVDYLENISSQATINYIPTTYTPTTNTNLEAKVRYTGGASGATWAIGAASWWGIHYQGQGPKIGITNSSSDQYQVYAPYTAGNDITLKLDGSNVYADGTLVGSLTKQNASSTLTLFRYSNSANLSWVGRIYYLDIWDNNGYVYKFRPAIDENGVGFMFDRVSHTIYDNAGTGNFAYPPVPIKWVQTDGINSYINTNEIPPSAGILKYLQTKVATLNVFQNSPIFGNAQSEEQVCWGLEYYNSSYSYAYAATKKSYPIHFTSITASSSPVERSIIVTSTQSVYIDGLTYDISAEEYQGTQNNTTICLGRLGPNIIPSAEAHNRFYSAKILNAFVPVFKDGKAGMLNTGTNEFCGNAGTGTIVGGPIIESG